MTNVLLYYLIVINVVTFLVYGIDKWRSTSGRLLPTGRKKAKQGSWRISEATLLMLAVIIKLTPQCLTEFKGLSA